MYLYDGALDDVKHSLSTLNSGDTALGFHLNFSK